jgi:hypothetical protein
MILTADEKERDAWMRALRGTSEMSAALDHCMRSNPSATQRTFVTLGTRK